MTDLSDWDGVVRICKDCKEECHASELRFGLCEDCYDDLTNQDLEDQLDLAFYIASSQKGTNDD